ncbi:fatty acid hydroxylase domain-containing protein 2 [Nephila pilipes]|uniref:Fatty acid hydroxylase domain-containing protein 2 n=1 Tax=Nephila pilipes TaxID=299642 RepID=A0A8X6NEM9_NEPPI|nr:fatty acid hydroxylase domain-containing protein 2 [Nephila pilipes]
MNYTTFNLQYYWETSGNVLQKQWNVVHELFGSDFTLTVWGSFIVTTLVYWIFGLFYTLIDLTGKPKCLFKYKIQDTASNPVSFSQVFEVTKQVIFNQVIFIPCRVVFYYFMVWRGYDSGKTLPSFQRVTFEIIFHAIMNETLFYYTHRIMHHSSIYKYVHKRHHEWTAPIVITAIYCHPLEHIFGNVFSILPSFFILGSHVSVWWVWFCFALLFTMNNHSGFRFPFMPSPEYHDYHHVKFDQNYGLVGFLDWLHGTDLSYRKKALEHSMIPSSEDIFEDDFIFKQYSTSSNTSKVTSSLLNNNEITILPLPTNSPNLNLMKNVRGLMKKHLQELTLKDKNKLVESVKSVWATILKDIYNN